MKYLTFEELTELAVKDGVKPNRVAVGKWAKDKGYISRRIMINKTLTTVYYG